MHPLFRDPQITDEHLLWSECPPDQPIEIQLGKRIRLMELAEKYGLKFSKELSAASLRLKLDGYPRYLITGEEGDIEPDTLQALVRLLQQYIRDDRCYFLYGLLKTEEYIDTLFQGELAEVVELSKRTGLRGTPTYWWPADKAWCLYTDYDVDFSIVGGSRELIDALLAHDFLECIECGAAIRIDNQADYTNKK